MKHEWIWASFDDVDKVYYLNKLCKWLNENDAVDFQVVGGKLFAVFARVETKEDSVPGIDETAREKYISLISGKEC